MDRNRNQTGSCLKLLQRGGNLLRGSPASFTVEASYVMTIVLLSLAFLIRTAYKECREVTGIMRLHHMVEFARCREDETPGEFSFQTVRGSVLKKGDKVYGTAVGENWQKEIESGIFEPESRMRMLTVFDNLAEGDKRDDGT